MVLRAGMSSMFLSSAVVVVVLSVVVVVVAVTPVILPPTKTSATEAAVIIVPGASIHGTAYRPLGEVIQKASSLKLWVVLLDGFLINDPNPLELPGAIDAAALALRTQGMTSHNIFLAGHSLGGVFVGEYGPKHAGQLKGILLFASYLTRHVRLSTYPLPVLHISGDLDGQTRITRIADTFEEYQKDVTTHASATFRTPVIVLPGVTHAQFASGPMPKAVSDKDLKPEVSSQTAYQMIANQIAAFLVTSLGAPAAEVTVAKATLENAVNKTSEIMEPLLAAKHFDANDQKSDQTAIFAQYMEAVLPKTTLKVNNVILEDPDFTLSKPSVSITATGPAVTTYAKLSYQMNPMDISTSMSSPQEVAVKLKSFQAIQQATHILTPNAGGHLTCKDFNQEAINQAMKLASPVAKQRYQTHGRHIILNNDINCTTGLEWTMKSIELHETATSLNVSSPALQTALSQSNPVFGGMHYCKMLSPYRVMEWMYVDSLRNHTT